MKDISFLNKSKKTTKLLKKLLFFLFAFNKAMELQSMNLIMEEQESSLIDTRNTTLSSIEDYNNFMVNNLEETQLNLMNGMRDRSNPILYTISDIIYSDFGKDLSVNNDGVFEFNKEQLTIKNLYEALNSVSNLNETEKEFLKHFNLYFQIFDEYNQLKGKNKENITKTFEIDQYKIPKIIESINKYHMDFFFQTTKQQEQSLLNKQNTLNNLSSKYNVSVEVIKFIEKQIKERKTLHFSIEKHYYTVQNLLFKSFAENKNKKFMEEFLIKSLTHFNYQDTNEFQGNNNYKTIITEFWKDINKQAVYNDFNFMINDMIASIKQSTYMKLKNSLEIIKEISEEVKKLTHQYQLIPVSNFKELIQSFHDKDYDNMKFSIETLPDHITYQHHKNKSAFIAVKKLSQNSMLKALKFSVGIMAGDLEPKIYLHRDNLLWKHPNYLKNTVYCGPSATDFNSNKELSQFIFNKIKENKNNKKELLKIIDSILALDPFYYRDLNDYNKYFQKVKNIKQQLQSNNPIDYDGINNELIESISQLLKRKFAVFMSYFYDGIFNGFNGSWAPVNVEMFMENKINIFDTNSWFLKLFYYQPKPIQDDGQKQLFIANKHIYRINTIEAKNIDKIDFINNIIEKMPQVNTEPIPQIYIIKEENPAIESNFEIEVNKKKEQQGERHLQIIEKIQNLFKNDNSLGSKFINFFNMLFNNNMGKSILLEEHTMFNNLFTNLRNSTHYTENQKNIIKDFLQDLFNNLGRIYDENQGELLENFMKKFFMLDYYLTVQSSDFQLFSTFFSHSDMFFIPQNVTYDNLLQIFEEYNSHIQYKKQKNEIKEIFNTIIEDIENFHLDSQIMKKNFEIKKEQILGKTSELIGNNYYKQTIEVELNNLSAIIMQKQTVLFNLEEQQKSIKNTKLLVENNEIIMNFFHEFETKQTIDSMAELCTKYKINFTEKIKLLSEQNTKYAILINKKKSNETIKNEYNKNKETIRILSLLIANINNLEMLPNSLGVCKKNINNISMVFQSLDKLYPTLLNLKNVMNSYNNLYNNLSKMNKDSLRLLNKQYRSLNNAIRINNEHLNIESSILSYIYNKSNEDAKKIDNNITSFENDIKNKYSMKKMSNIFASLFHEYQGNKGLNQIK